MPHKQFGQAKFSSSRKSIKVASPFHSSICFCLMQIFLKYLLCVYETEITHNYCKLFYLLHNCHNDYSNGYVYNKNKNSYKNKHIWINLSADTLKRNRINVEHKKHLELLEELLKLDFWTVFRLFVCKA